MHADRTPEAWPRIAGAARITDPARIIAYRESEGPFRTVADVLAVRGIGPRPMERFEASVTVGAGDGE